MNGRPDDYDWTCEKCGKGNNFALGFGFSRCRDCDHPYKTLEEKEEERRAKSPPVFFVDCPKCSTRHSTKQFVVNCTFCGTYLFGK